MSGRKILLLEPNYKNKYPPMGLMKLATYYRCRHDDVRFFKGDLKSFAARLLFEEYFENIDASDSVDNLTYNYVLRLGADQIIDFIKTGRNSIIENIANYSSLSEDLDECSFAQVQSRLSCFHKRYKKEDYPKFDVVGVTTLFTFYWKQTVNTINFAKKFCKPRGQIHVGGIASTLVPDYIEQETGIKPHIGLLDKPYAYDNDKKGNVIIDNLPLDYSILEEIDYQYPTGNAYFGYMTRGCVNHCAFCAVPKLEPDYCDYASISEKIKKVDECFGAKKDLMLMDNNVFASKCFEKIIDEIKDCGFQKGATYIPHNEYDVVYRNICEGFHLGNGKMKNVFNHRAYFRKIIKIYDSLSERLPADEKGAFYNERESLGLLFSETATTDNIIIFHNIAKPIYDKYFKQNKRVRFIDFNQGLDSRLAFEDKMSKLSEIAIRPLRIAFDHWSMSDKYEKAIRTAAENGIKDLSNYLLYNFKDKPDELYYRMKLNIDLCEELGVTIYSFPMKYHPIDDPDYFRNRDYIGKPHWNRKFIRAIQAVLNSTHGKIGRGKTFFEAAFGKDIEEFHKILWMPEALIIQRYKYDAKKRREYYGRRETPYDGVDKETGRTTDAWWRKFTSLNEEQRSQAESIISLSKFTDEDIAVKDKKVKEVLKFYQIKRDESK